MSDNSKWVKSQKEPYNPKSNYGKIFGAWRKAQIMTHAQLVEFAMGLGLELSAAKSSATVMISPRKSPEDCRGDYRGNISAAGEYYYADKLNRKKGEAQKFRLRYRAEVLEPRVRKVKEELKSVKVETKAGEVAVTTSAPVEA